MSAWKLPKTPLTTSPPGLALNTMVAPNGCKPAVWDALRKAMGNLTMGNDVTVEASGNDKGRVDFQMTYTSLDKPGVSWTAAADIADAEGSPSALHLSISKVTPTPWPEDGSAQAQVWNLQSALEDLMTTTKAYKVSISGDTTAPTATVTLAISPVK